jgi:hypothetical protein
VAWNVLFVTQPVPCRLSSDQEIPMNLFCRLFLLCLSAAPVSFVPLLAGDSDDKEIERLVKQLDSDSFAERQAATKRLTEIGEPVLDALGKAKGSLEVRRRAEAIIAVIEDKICVDRRLLPDGPPCCRLIRGGAGNRRGVVRPRTT